MLGTTSMASRILEGLASCATLAPLSLAMMRKRFGKITDLRKDLTESTKGLVRTIGRWSLAALMVNTMIGASIFGLPALIAARLGKWSPLGFLVAFAGISII